MQRDGFRVTPDRLRSQVQPFVSPTASARAQAAIARWQANPANAQLLKDHPEQAVTAMVPWDRDGDGVAENVSLRHEFAHRDQWEADGGVFIAENHYPIDGKDGSGKAFGAREQNKKRLRYLDDCYMVPDAFARTHCQEAGWPG